MIETGILFPTSKLVFRQQLLGLMAKEAATQVCNLLLSSMLSMSSLLFLFNLAEERGSCSSL